MRFLRRRSSPALVLLLALAMQTAAIMAHAHVHPHPPTRAGVQGTGASAALACRALVRPADCGPAVPRDHHHDDCPLCWSLAAAGAGMLPSPLTIAATAVPSQTVRPATVTAALSDAGTAPFQARGPPTT